MKGRLVLIEPRAGGGHAAALVVDGRLEDLLIDPEPTDPTPRPGAIHRAVPARPMKGLGGVMLDLGGGQTGFLRTPRPPAPGRPLLVQVAAWAEPGKAPPVSERLRLKGATALLTPGAPGLNVARGVSDPQVRARLLALAQAAMAGAPPDLGLILRSAAVAEPDAVAAEVAQLLAAWAALPGAAGPPGCVLAAPGAADEARRDWPAAAVREGEGALAELCEEVEALRRPLVPLGLGTLAIEATQALVAVDVNTGGDLTPAAALKANLAAMRELPRQLRLRGLGGQITIDPAPLAKADRRGVEAALAAALRADGIDTSIAGWTPLGHLELNRKRARRPLADRVR